MRGVRKLAWVEVKLFIREPLALIFAFAFPFFMLFILVGVFGNDIDTADPEGLRVWRGVGPSDYYVSTYVGLVMASAGLITFRCDWPDTARPASFADIVRRVSQFP